MAFIPFSPSYKNWQYLVLLFMISFQNNFIFVHAGRTGGSSLERLAGVELTTDNRTMHLGNTDFYEKHKDFQYYRENYPKEFSSFFKFTIVRNPFDRIVSAWKWQTVIVKNNNTSTLKEFIKNRPASSKYSEKFKLEGYSIFDAINQFDYIGRFEDIITTYDYICKALNIKAINMPHTNKTSFTQYQDYYDDETIEMVRENFQIDLELFGYEFDVK